MLAVNRVLVSRGWLVAAPVWVAGAGVLLWAAHAWGWWDWLRGLITVLAALVGLGVLVTLWFSTAFLTGRGFWLPGEGAGRWGDVIDRLDLTLTLRKSTRWGSVAFVDFGRLRGWSTAGRVLDSHVPAGLPGLAQAVPHAEHVKRINDATDPLLQALAARREVPAFDRRWVGPTADLMVHAVGIFFAPTPVGATIEVLVADASEPAQIKVDGTFWAASEVAYDREPEDVEREGNELEGFALEGYEQELFNRSVAALAALLDDMPRSPLLAWRITGDDGQTYDFLPRKVD